MERAVKKSAPNRCLNYIVILEGICYTLTDVDSMVSYLYGYVIEYGKGRGIISMDLTIK